ncbi:Transcriptional regulatory protein ZraR [Anaerohalosphaera lusitana]|uniref:Transcriptional regulatory protein ZraR n=1 Tax=Anaerohalosphaera lusitana TaxID=1936003 RepID=A0A1U9NJQ2_9BACT|nr:sigma 54-interacting transcriptional regulator [Anaerohalosphaera lusitana]AQT68163.1 Transcriptional regulatory protein ZraR [Anaerohalosphaera lusitana]
MDQLKLTQSDRNFFELVSRATFTNPFSPERVEIDRRISGRNDGASWPSIMPQAVKEVSTRLRTLEETAPIKIKDFAHPDRTIIEHALLFDAFHKYAYELDAIIDQQLASPDKSIDVPFAPELLAGLRTAGLARDRARRYLELFYQIRRAFFFIDKNLLGRSPSMQKLRMNLWNNIFTHDILHYERYLWDKMEDFSTLLLGPTGCGKGTAAAAIGQSGYIPFDENKNCFAESFTRTFIPINLSEYPESLIESELFGHTKGSFTGAVSAHEGIFSLCSPHGSIFLDEIGDISTQIQIKLLRVLQERTFSPVGNHEKLRFSGRVIAATNQNIDSLRSEGKFRDDFYYRLCSDCIAVPSLHQRIKEDPAELEQLVNRTIASIAGDNTEFAPMVMDVIKSRLGKHYAWPGNVRELEQCVRSVIIKRDYDGRHCQTANPNRSTIDISDEPDAQQLLARYCATLYDKYGTLGEVARRTALDRRTVKKHIERHCKNAD